MLEYVKKDYNKSIDLFTKSIAINSKYVNAYVARSTAFAALGDFDKAIIDQSKAIILEPKNVDFLSNRAFFYAENKQFKESLDDIMTKIKLEPENLGNYQEAVAAGHNIDATFNCDVIFNQALLIKTINKSKVEKLFADCLSNDSRFQEAEVHYLKALKEDESHFTGNNYHNLAIASQKISNFEAAISYYREAISKSQSEILIYNNLSSVLVLMKRWQELKENSELALQINPNDAAALTYMAIALKKTDNQSLAAEYESKIKNSNYFTNK